MIRIFCISAALAGFVALTANGQAAAQTWTVGETGMLRSLWIGSLGKLPQDPSNAFADDPMAAELGHKIFFDPRFSANAKVSCATCHQPELAFTDGLPLAQGVGAVPGHTPTIIGMAYSPWFFWDGRKDSQWSQALGPMESPVEHGGTRTQYAKIVYADPAYRKAYERIFSALPDVSDGKRFPARAAPIDVPESKKAWDGMSPADRKTVSRIYANIGKALHNWGAWGFMLGVIVIFVLWVRHNILDRYDFMWIAKGGGLFASGVHPPSRKFNFGQKFIFWSVVIGGIVLSVTGIILMFPFSVTDIAGMQLAHAGRKASTRAPSASPSTR